MIYEITGSPGSGKSYIKNYLKNSLKSETVTFYPFFKSNIIDFIVVDILLFPILFTSLNNLKVIYLVIGDIVKSRNRLIHKLNILRNIIKKVNLSNFFKKSKKRILIIDEGSCHIIYNLYVDGSSKVIPVNKIKTIFSLLPIPDKLVYIDADFLLIKKVLMVRGHTRFFSLDEKEKENFFEKLIIINDILKSIVQEKSNIYIYENKWDNSSDSLLRITEFLTAKF